MRLWFLTLVFALAGCSAPSADTDGVTWEARCDDLVPGKYKACYGPGWDKSGHKDHSKFENYQISVERLDSNSSSSVLYQQKFSASDVNPRLLNREAQRVVYFNAAKRHVVFELGKPTASYTLP